jgi:hypothetical protein
MEEALPGASIKRVEAEMGTCSLSELAFRANREDRAIDTRVGHNSITGGRPGWPTIAPGPCIDPVSQLMGMV